MGINVNMTKDLSRLVISLLILAAVAILIVPTLYGVGDKTARAMEVNGTATYTALETMVEDTAGTTGDLFEILPWVGVGLAFMALVGINKIL